MQRAYKSELVLGLVTQVGTDLTSFRKVLEGHLREFGYDPAYVRASELLKSFKNLGVPLKESPEFDRLESYMTAGNELRKKTSRNDVLALQAVAEINKMRGVSEKIPLSAKAHIIDSLKHPEEVRALRRIYGPGFFLIGIYSPHASRLQYLQDQKKMSLKEAEQVAERDQYEREDFGQKTRETFHLADVFINASTPDMRDSLTRFLDIIFGYPFFTPTQDEHAMFMAFAASLRSADLSRQVGAAVVSTTGDILATGANDVPKFGGGQYWPGSGDARDHVLGSDPNSAYRDKIVVEIMQALNSKAGLGESNVDQLLKEGKSLLKHTRLFNLTEFGRVVHAEMEAILGCARAGINPRGAFLFTTTFPCHNCAKHIIAAGIHRVVFVEPYPKSLAEPLHKDAIRIADTDVQGKNTEGAVLFEPFVGIGPRRYFDLFAMALGSGNEVKRKTPDGNKVKWMRKEVVPKVAMPPQTYIDMENLYISELNKAIGGTP